MAEDQRDGVTIMRRLKGFVDWQVNQPGRTTPENTYHSNHWKLMKHQEKTGQLSSTDEIDNKKH